MRYEEAQWNDVVGFREPVELDQGFPVSQRNNITKGGRMATLLFIVFCLKGVQNRSMKKPLGIFLIAVALAGFFFSAYADIRTTYCCSCNVDEWRFGVGIRALYERDHILCSCAANIGCAPAYKLIPVDILGAAFVFFSIGTWIVFGVRSKTKSGFDLIRNEFLDVAEKTPGEDASTKRLYMKRITEGVYSRDENPASHFCVYFLPYNKKTGEVFIVHHKKSGLWIAPGGHVGKGENLHATVNREIFEELGVRNFFVQTPDPFLLTITAIERATSPCRFHFDIWYLMETDGSNFRVDPKEFHSTAWMSFYEARQKSTNVQNRRAFDMVEKRP